MKNFFIFLFFIKIISADVVLSGVKLNDGASIDVTPSSWRLTRYIDADAGSDSNDGRSEQFAWQTLAKSTSSANAGELILLKGGCTWAEALIPISGTESQYTTYSSYGEGIPIVNDITITQKEYINFIGIESDTVGEGYERCLNIKGSNNLTFTNCIFDGKSVSNSSGGIVTLIYHEFDWTYDVTFDSCTVKNAADPAGGLCINDGCYSITIQNCTIFNNYQTNTQAYSESAEYAPYNITWTDNEIYNPLPFDNDYETGINFGWYCYNSTASGNTIYNCRVPIQFDADAHDNVVSENTITNGKNALVMFRANATAGSAGTDNNQCINNTFVSNNGETVGIAFYSNSGIGGTGNICSGNSITTTTDNYKFIDGEYFNDAAELETTLSNNTYSTTQSNYTFTWFNTVYNDFSEWQASGKDIGSTLN